MKSTTSASTSPAIRKPKGPENKWSPQEDEILAAAVAASGYKVCWRKIAMSLPGRTNKSCRKRWIHSLDPTLKKGRWTAQEDKILLSAIKMHGTLWYKVAKHLPGRTDDQAAKRYREKLDPSISRSPWTEEEDEILIKMWRQVGKRWNLISKELNGRPAVHCRNRWQSLFRIGKVEAIANGSDPSADHDDEMVDNDDLDRDDSGDIFLSPNESLDMPNLSASSSSSSSPISSNLSTPVQTTRSLVPGLSDTNDDPVFLFNLQSRKAGEGCDTVDHINDQLSYQHPMPSSPARPSSNSSAFYDLVDSVLGREQPQVQRSPIALDQRGRLPESYSSSSHSRNQLGGAGYQFFSDIAASTPRSASACPELFMVPHPNMRVMSGPQLSSHVRSHHQRSHSLDMPFSFSPPAQASSSSPAYYPYDLTSSPLSAPHSYSPSSIHGSTLSSLSAQMPQRSVDNYMLTCPLVHCGFQSTNLIDLWKHVTWDHVSPNQMPSVSRPTPSFDLGLPSNDFTASSDGVNALKMDPGMMDFVERVVLDLESDGQGNTAHIQEKRNDLDISMGFGMGLDDLDSTTSSLAVPINA